MNMDSPLTTLAKIQQTALEDLARASRIMRVCAWLMVFNVALSMMVLALLIF